MKRNIAEFYFLWVALVLAFLSVNASAQSTYRTHWFQFDIKRGWQKEETGGDLPSLTGPRVGSGFFKFPSLVSVEFGVASDSLSDLAVARIEEVTADDRPGALSVIAQRFFQTPQGYSAHEYYVEDLLSRARYLDAVLVYEGKNYILSMKGSVLSTDSNNLNDVLKMFNSARLVIDSPNITRHPQSQIVTAGQTLVLEIAVASLPSYDIQWYRDNVPLEPTGDRLEIQSFQRFDAGNYWAIAKNSEGETRSKTASVRFRSPGVSAPSMSKAPEGGAVAEGETFALGASFTGLPPIRYQWYRDGKAIQGATDANYQVDSANATHQGSYFIRATNRFGSAQSSTVSVSLKVNSPPSQLVFNGGTVQPDAPVGSIFGELTLRDSDPDDSTSFTLSGDAAPYLAIEGPSVIVSRALTAIAGTELQFVITARDQRGTSIAKTFLLSVAPAAVPEPSPPSTESPLVVNAIQPRITLNSGELLISVDSTAGIEYKFERSNDLVIWVEHGNAIRGDGNTINLRRSPTAPAGFWRVIANTDNL